MKAVPERIAREARRRVEQASTSRAAVYAAIRDNRPLDAEDNEERKLNYIQARVGVCRDTATRIANYENPEGLALTPAQKTLAESVQGNTVDFLPISFLPIGRAASRSVARVAFRNGNPQGTGFMISPRLFLTNQHVITDANDAKSFILEFDQELDASKRARQLTRFNIDATFFLSEPEDDLDFALMTVGPKIDGPHEFADFGFLPLLDTPDKHIKGAFVNVIQHPEGRPKEVVIRENRIIQRTENTLIYGTDTLPGSSGSPVFNDDWEVIALHHFGGPHLARVDDQTIAADLAGNEGIRISSIVRHLRNELPKLQPTLAALLQEALNPPFRHPSLVEGFSGKEDAANSRNQRNEAFPRGNTIANDGTLSVTLPLVVSFKLGGAPHPALTPQAAEPAALPPSEPVPAETFEAIFTPDSQYSNRRGYNRKFLGQVVELPKLHVALRELGASNLRARKGDDPLEFKYEHFSLFMHGKRQLPFFTAVNIDGSSVVKINRKTGAVTSEESLRENGFESSETWYDDPRIDAAQTTNQKLYNSDAFRNFFQRGHLVKRTDPSWGTEDAARKGQADTFHFTNCSPQHKLFNPIRSRWAGLEAWITDGSDDEDLRVTVFTGPIFREDDPLFATIRVPREYWKIVVRVDEGELLATAVLADQSDLLAHQESIGEAAGPEDIPSFPDNLQNEYQLAVGKIEQLTGLDFGPLRNHDTFTSGSEGIESRRKIGSMQDISIQRKER